MIRILVILCVCVSAVQCVGSCCTWPKKIRNGNLSCNNGELNITCNDGFSHRRRDTVCGRAKITIKGQRSSRRMWLERHSTFQWKRLSYHSTCTASRCPEPKLKNGNLWYNGGIDGDTSYRSVVKADCSHGYTLYGSPNRTCQINSRWSGVRQTCQPIGRSSQDNCQDPGIPDGATVELEGLKTHDRIRYWCSDGLVSFGDSMRQCLPGGKWSGSPFVCYARHSYDLVEDVSLGLARNLDDLKVETCNHDNRTCLNNYDELCKVYGNCVMYQRMEKHLKGGRKKRFLDTASKQGLDLYIAIDNSNSISDANFVHAKEFVRSAIKKLGLANWEDRDQPGTRFEIHAFNNEVTTIVDLFDDGINTTEALLNRFDQKIGHLTTIGGTSIPKVLETIRESIVTTRKGDGTSQHNREIIVILLSDGASNMGGHPKAIADTLKNDLKAKILGIHLKAKDDTNDLDVMKDIVSDDEPDRKYHHIMNSPGEREDAIKKLLNTSTDYSPCGEQGHEISHSMVSHGMLSKPGQWPWMVQILRNKKPICGSTILDNSTLLSAAHCFFNKGKTGTWKRIPDKEFGAVSGTLGDGAKDDSTYAKKLTIKNIITHELYNKDNITQGHDIAIVNLDKPIIFTRFVRPICINDLNIKKIKDDHLETPTQDVTVAGWGDTHDGDNSRNLRHGIVQLADDCGDKLCAGTGGSKTCKGDFGGPLMNVQLDTGGKERYYEIGIVSYGNEGKNGKCEDVTKSYFTKISSYVEWIRKNTSIKIPEPKT